MALDPDGRKRASINNITIPAYVWAVLVDVIAGIANAGWRYLQVELVQT
jgi:hypothetical protein